MTIKQFQELYFITQSKEIDIDKSIKLVGVINKMTPDKVELMSVKRFNKECRKVNRHFEIFNKNMLNTTPKKFIWVNGRCYRIIYEASKANAGRYVEVMTFGKDIINNLHKVMASIVEPVNWRGKPYERRHESIALDMEDVDFKAAYHAAVFFYTHYSVSMQLIQPYLIQELTAKGMSREKAQETLNGFTQTLDGFTMPEWSQNLKEYLLNRFGGLA
jgi:hypothetical protein